MSAQTQVVTTGVEPGRPVFETRDLDFVSLLLSRSMYAVKTVGEGVAHPVQSRVRLADVSPFMNKDATNPEKGVHYTFLLQSEDGEETEKQLSDRMAHIELLFINKQLCVEPIGFSAWRRQLRTWMTETDKRRRNFLHDHNTRQHSSSRR